MPAIVKTSEQDLPVKTDPVKSAATITPLQVAVFDFDVFSLLEPLLSYREVTFEPGGELGYRRVATDKMMATFDIKGRLVIPAGLLPRCEAELAAHGYRVVIHDQRPSDKRFAVDDDAMDGVTEEECAVLEAAKTNPLGQIEVQSHAETVRHIVAISRLYRKARIVVAVPTKRDVGKLSHALRQTLRPIVGHQVSGSEMTDRRCVVSTYTQLHAFQSTKGMILLLVDPEKATREVGTAAIASTHFPRVYAFVPPKSNMDPQTRLRLEAMAGPVIHGVEQPKIGVHVVMVSTPASKITATTGALEWKRAAYWHNQCRNESVARVARAFTSEDGKSRGDLLGEEVINVETSFYNRRVTVLVECTEHARQLLQLLPDWKLVAANSEQADCVDEESTTGRKLIVTQMAALRYSINADVVIRATGGAGRLPVQVFPMPDASKQRTVIVVDFDDRFDPKAMQYTAGRIREYQAAGYTITTATLPKAGEPVKPTQGGKGKKSR
ncbi:MAG: hypothetical protein U0792_06935 [Gemmataceae bacterium]